MPNLRIILLWVLLNPCVGVKFSIVHNNDMHSRYDPISENYGKCKEHDDENGFCYGGFARVATYVDQVRSNGSVLYLNSGNNYQGTSWFTIYKGGMIAEMLNMLKPDVVALGSYEFGDGIEGLLPFLDTINAPVVCCNLDLRKELSLKHHKRLKNSTILKKFDTKIGIVGYLTTKTKQTVVTDVQFYNEIEAINAETRRLVEQGVNIIIALGSSGYAMDQDIAKNCPDVDIVVGGYSQTFLCNGAPPDKERSVGAYPTIVLRPNGIQVPVVQAFAYTKYMGKIDLEFDARGKLINFHGAPILLDKNIAEQADIKKFLDTRREAINAIETTVIGTTVVFLNGERESCRREECNFGNLITDSFVYARVKQKPLSHSWTDASIALINSGGIRASIDPGENGAVTGEDIATVLPYRNELFYTEITGKQLIEVLEHSARLRNRAKDGGFLQVSGLRVNFNFNRPRGKRVTSISVLCSICKVPSYERVNKNKVYRVIVTHYLLAGGDGHKVKDPDNPIFEALHINDSTAVIQYLQEHKIVFPAIEQRIGNVEKRHSHSYGNRICGLIRLIGYVLFLHCTF